MKTKLKNILKRIPFLKNIYNKIKFKKEFNKDYKFFLKNYTYSKTSKNKTGYKILLIVHSLEKGLSNSKPRPFGKEKIKDLISLLNKHNQKKEYSYIMGINVLRSYAKFYEINKWTDNEEYINVSKFLENKKNINLINAGSFELKKEDFINDSKIDYDKFLSSRHSVRNFSSRKLSKHDIETAIKITMKSPSACNRQMCKIYYVENDNAKKQIINIGQGFGNFDLSNVNLFMVTFDMNANYFIGERNQGWFNAGLFSMNFINSLHSLGIGSCFVQFGNTFKEEKKLKKELEIPDNERIAVLIAAGYYDDISKIPYSTRKDLKEFYKII